MNIEFLTLNRISNDVKESTQNAILQLVNKLSNTLKLDDLKTIFITSDFSIDLINFQRDNKIREGFTNNEKFDLMGKTVAVYKEGNLKQFIFLNEIIPLGLISHSPQYFAHILHHELGHVHDHHINYNYFKKDLFLFDEYTVENLLNAHSLTNWGEFYATFISFPTMPQKGDLSFNFELDDLQNSTIESESRVLSSKYKYQTRELDLETFFNTLQRETNFILNRISRSIGYIIAVELNLKNGLSNEIEKDLADSLRSTKYFEILSDLINAFLLHLKDYEKWDRMVPFKENSKVIASLWKKFGVQISNTHGQIKVDVF